MERRPPPAPLKAWAILSLCGTAGAEDMMLHCKLIIQEEESEEEEEKEV
jgi:hypothetical protein